MIKKETLGEISFLILIYGVGFFAGHSCSRNDATVVKKQHKSSVVKKQRKTSVKSEYFNYVKADYKKKLKKANVKQKKRIVWEINNYYIKGTAGKEAIKELK